MIRRALTDGQRQRIEPLIAGKEGDKGRHGDDNRLFVDAVLWLVRGRTMNGAALPRWPADCPENEPFFGTESIFIADGTCLQFRCGYNEH